MQHNLFVATRDWLDQPSNRFRRRKAFAELPPAVQKFYYHFLQSKPVAERFCLRYSRTYIVFVWTREILKFPIHFYRAFREHLNHTPEEKNSSL